MRISFNWLKTYIALEEEATDVAEVLTHTGLEVEGITHWEEIPGSLQGLVVGEVLTCQKHEGADQLKVTTVAVGGHHTLAIVCGAPNVAQGQKVVVAPIGVTLYPTSGEPFKIKKTKIRGVVSEGMICAEDEIGLGRAHDGILTLDTDLPNGTPAKAYFKPEEDQIFEIGLTPNRADAASHFGVARDLKAAYGLPACWPDLTAFQTTDATHPIKVYVEDREACPRYSGITLTGLSVKPSPRWLQNRLKGIGLTPINNVVDVTNYVLHALGQPLHAFDWDKIDGHQVIVKTLADGTKFTTLDGKERTLCSQDVMICDASEPMCIAGVFGGIRSGINESTKTIFLESAYFSAQRVRRTATRYGLKTDASFRYERGTDPNITVRALQWAAMLIQEVAGGRVSSELADIYPKPMANVQISIRYKHIDRLVGVVLPRPRIHEILEALDIEVLDRTESGFCASVPPYRVDVTREADVVEEILRIYGYNQIEIAAQHGAGFLAPSSAPDLEKIQAKTAEFLAARGFHEIVTNALTRPKDAEQTDDLAADESVAILNPLSEELSVMRQTLVFSGLEVLKYNINRKQTNLKLFEFGKVYTKAPSGYDEKTCLSLFLTGHRSEESWNATTKPVDFHDLSAVVHQTLERLGMTDWESKPSARALFDYGLDLLSHGKLLLSMGCLKPKISAQREVMQEVFYAEWDWQAVLRAYGKPILYTPIPKFPEARRDLSLVLDEGVCFEEIEALAQKTAKVLLKRMNVFSVYRGESLGQGKKSYALSFVLQHPSKTLNDKMIDKTMNALINNFENQLHAHIRK